MTLQELQAKGFRVRVRHFRDKRITFDSPQIHRGLAAVLARVDFAATGGATEVSVVTPEGAVYVGTSECSHKDMFCRRTGRELAMGRVVTALEKDGYV